jgi:hypothetical protein
MAISITAKRLQNPSQEVDVLIYVDPEVVGVPPDVKDLLRNSRSLDALDDAPYTERFEPLRTRRIRCYGEAGPNITEPAVLSY